ncbi:MAG: hypothetical protein U5K32_08050 [Bacteroidales bacterium]|nr:hypothetical protein [Bacteroidales bacterium]
MSEMIYPKEFELKVGFDRIRNRIYDLCLSQQGRDKAVNIGFTADRNEITT